MHGDTLRADIEYIKLMQVATIKRQGKLMTALITLADEICAYGDKTTVDVMFQIADRMNADLRDIEKEIKKKIDGDRDNGTE